jgi:acetyltransferase-like isoleucine patch superfamily enzyme
MNDRSMEQKLKPGDKLTTANELDAAVGIRIELADGAAIEFNVTIGAAYRVTVGRNPMKIITRRPDESLIGNPDGGEPPKNVTKLKNR